jgi:hypothetical protein
MAQLTIDDFRYGVDVRKSEITGRISSLREAQNVFINRGGELQKRYRFYAMANIPAASLGNVFGSATDGDRYYIVGHGAAPTLQNVETDPAWPAIEWYQIDAGANNVAKRIVDYTLYDGKLYLVVELNDGTRKHYYDKTLVTWNFPGDAAANQALQNTCASVLTRDQKIYALCNRTLYYSQLNVPTVWDTTTGAAESGGLIELGRFIPVGQRGTNLSVFREYLAIFFRHYVIMYQTDPDPAKNFYVNLMPNIGAVADQSVASYGTENLIFLAPMGVRSLQQTYGTSIASTSDIGTPIDDVLSDLESFDQDALAIIEPLTGQYWLKWAGGIIFVFSKYSESEVQGWSTFLTGFEIQDMRVWNSSRVILLSNDGTILIYGGGVEVGHEEFDGSFCAIRTPYMDLGAPGVKKTMTQFDMGMLGTWQVRLGDNPLDVNSRQIIGTFAEHTYSDEIAGMNSFSSHFDFDMYSEENGPSLINNVTLHYNIAETQ